MINLKGRQYKSLLLYLRIWNNESNKIYFVCLKDTKHSKTEHHNINEGHVCDRGSVTSVSVATGYGLNGQGIESHWGEFLRASPDRPWGQPSFLKMVNVSFQFLKSGWGVSMPLHPHLVPWWRKSRGRPLHTQWTVEPVKSLSALQRCTLTFTYVCDQWQAFWTWNWTGIFRNLYITGTIKTSPVALYCMQYLNTKHRRNVRAVLTVGIVRSISGQCGHHTAGLSGSYFCQLVIQKQHSVR
jgi:hypothetical protein